MSDERPDIIVQRSSDGVRWNVLKWYPGHDRYLFWNTDNMGPYFSLMDTFALRFDSEELAWSQWLGWILSGQPDHTIVTTATERMFGDPIPA